MVACFFEIIAHERLCHWSNVGRSIRNVTELFVCQKSLSNFGKRWRIILHHDRASCRILAETKEFLKRQNTMGHSSYSPNLAPNNFCVSQHQRNLGNGFLHLKKQLYSKFRSGKSALKNSNACKSVLIFMRTFFEKQWNRVCFHVHPYARNITSPRMVFVIGYFSVRFGYFICLVHFKL